MATPDQLPLPHSECERACQHFLNSSDGRALSCQVLESKSIEQVLSASFAAGWRSAVKVMETVPPRPARTDVIPTTISRTLLRLLAGAEITQDEKIDALAWVGARC